MALHGGWDSTAVPPLLHPSHPAQKGCSDGNQCNSLVLVLEVPYDIFGNKRAGNTLMPPVLSLLGSGSKATGADQPDAFGIFTNLGVNIILICSQPLYKKHAVPLTRELPLKLSKFQLTFIPDMCAARIQNLLTSVCLSTREPRCCYLLSYFLGH